jgi:hypothetical protein
MQIQYNKNIILSIAKNLPENELDEIIVKLQKILLDKMFPKDKKGERHMKI